MFHDISFSNIIISSVVFSIIHNESDLLRSSMNSSSVYFCSLFFTLSLVCGFFVAL